MPRKKRVKETEPVALAEPLQAVAERHGLTTGDKVLAQLDPPTHVERHRPTGPRRRDGEPGASYAGKDVRVIKDGHMWQVQVDRDLTAQEHDRMHRSGFEPVDDAARTWNASQRDLERAGTDINILAVTLDAKGERLGRSR